MAPAAAGAHDCARARSAARSISTFWSSQSIPSRNATRALSATTASRRARVAPARERPRAAALRAGAGVETREEGDDQFGGAAAPAAGVVLEYAAVNVAIGIAQVVVGDGGR